MDEKLSVRISEFFRTGRFLEAAALLESAGGTTPDYRTLHNQAAALEAGATLRLTLPLSPRIEPGIEDLSMKPVLAEDLRDLLVETPEDDRTLLV